MTQKKVPIPGHPVGEMQQEVLLNEKQKMAEEKLAIIEEINKLSFPCNVTVFTHGESWTFRNSKFWKLMQKKDDDVNKFLVEYLTNTK